MHDLRAIRENPEQFDKNWARRGLSSQTGEILKLDERKMACRIRIIRIASTRCPYRFQCCV